MADTWKPHRTAVKAAGDGITAAAEQDRAQRFSGSCVWVRSAAGT